MLARRVPLAFVTAFVALALCAQTNTAAGAGTYPAQPEPNSFANLGVRPEVLPWDQGEAGLHLLAKKLKNTGRIMHLTAHPDDEDGALLTYLARGQGRQVLLMSLTRGEGGQNRTGSNLWDELGVLRTLELLESTRYYGTELRFSRVADFGFSKSADETFKKWGGHEVPLRDIVYVIREWKPDVLFTRFSGTPRDGHGMHQASAILAPEAVKCAADPNCFPDQLKGDHALTTWQVLKLYMGNQGGEYTVRYDVSQIDPDTKMSYTQMALEGFKHQASQLSGEFKPPAGPNWRSYKLISTSIPNYKADKEQDFFDGIDTTVAGLAKRPEVAGMNWLGPELQTLSSELESIFRGKPDGIFMAGTHAQSIVKKLGATNDAGTTLASGRIKSLLAEVPDHYDDLLQIETGVVAAVDRPVTPGESIKLAFHISTHGSAIHPRGYSAGWFASKRYTGVPHTLTTQDLQRAKQEGGINTVVEVPKNLGYSRPHWHRDDPERDTTYKVDDESLATQPLTGPQLGGILMVQQPGSLATYGVPKEAEQRSSKKFTPVRLVPEISILFDRVSQVVSDAGTEFPVVLRVRNISGRISQATVRLETSPGLSAQPAEQDVRFSGAGTEQAVTFKVRADKTAKDGLTLKAVANSGKDNFAEGFSVVTRPDLDTFYYFQPAIQRVSIVDVNVPKNLRVGYIPGAGDDIFPVLQQLGLNAKQISNDELAKGDLHRYDTIVVGIRGYDERPEIRANNQRLLDFVKDGGTLIVQNQKAEDVFNSGHFTPYPATLGRQRVSVEEAPVDVLAPNDPIFNSPNKITQVDFDGWVQERGINFMSDWDAKFEPLLACNDPGEQPLKGGLLRAKYGKGTYIYTGYAFFRQLPAGVPGAVRLYVNLLNAGHESVR